MLTRPQTPPRKGALKNTTQMRETPKIWPGSQRGKHYEHGTKQSHRWWGPCRWSFCRIVERCFRRRWLSLQAGRDTQLKRPSSGNSPPDTAEEEWTSQTTPPSVFTSNEEHRRPLSEQRSITRINLTTFISDSTIRIQNNNQFRFLHSNFYFWWHNTN